MLFKWPIRWPIRVKFSIGLGLLLLLVIVLAGSGLYTTYAYRNLVKNLSWRAVELPLAAELSTHVADLRITLGELRGRGAVILPDEQPGDCVGVQVLLGTFRGKLNDVEQDLSEYRRQLEHKIRDGTSIADTEQEWATLGDIQAALERVHEANRDEQWMLDTMKIGQLDKELMELQRLSVELPGHLHHKLTGFATEVRNQYRALIVGTLTTGVTAALILLLYVKLFRQWVDRPLRTLIAGSREVAGGRFNYRIHLETRDEMAELAEAMNDMTTRFQAIRDDLDRQVQERTRQVVRNEQLASVGFLAAGVAHEINNPLATIAMSAESLVDRVRETLNHEEPEHFVIRQYLEMIQSEAFRCKGITEKLLDFSRVGEVKRQDTELGELIQSVIDMVGHLGRYQSRHIEFQAPGPVIASVNPQEIKQVVLNVLTNALDSLDEGGTVRVRLLRRSGAAEMIFADNGCGMEPDVLEHLFEPFFTQRRGGQGTGLGLSITYRIVNDHGGEIEAQSEGAGRGSTVRVRLPLVDQHKEKENHCRAA